jgi:beta-mannosidase
MIIRQLGSAVWLLVLMFVASSALIAQPDSNGKIAIPISSGWEFRQAATGETAANAAMWYPAVVPGDVHLDLLHNKLIPDPYYRENEAKLQWIENASWEYRTTINATPDLLKHRNIELVFDGIDSYADVYLNGKLILSADNAFRQFRADVKPTLKAGANQLLLVFPSPITKAKEMASKDPWQLKTQVEDKTYLRKPAYEYGWDWGPRFVTSGVWKPASIEAWDDARIADFHIAQPDVTAEVAHLAAEFDILSSVGGPATVVVNYERGTKKGEITQSIELHPGLNQFSFPVNIAKPDLWYPAGYGPQTLYTFHAQLKIANHTADQATKRTGLRKVVLRRDVDQWGRSFEFVINGVPVFGKGADVIPFDSFAPRVTIADYRRIMQAARDANMNMVRHWGGGYYETDEFYDLCDELGIMVWQDFMFGNDWQPGYYPWKLNVAAEADYQVRRLRDHPSIVIWCGNNETEAAFHWKDRDRLPADVRIKMWEEYVSVFSGILPRAVERLTPEIPYWPSSPSSDYEDTTADYQSGDMHNWNIWHGMEPLRAYENYFPRFMTEYGFQSFPEMRTIEAFTIPEDRTGITTPVLLAHQKNAAGNQKIHEYLLRDYNEPKDFPSFLYVSQVLQAEAIKIGAEHLRRIRPRSMGSIYWQLNDCWPVASWASLDYYGRWKALQFYAKRFYNDVLVSPHEEDGSVAVYVVSDRTTPVNGDLKVTLMGLDGQVLKTSTQAVQIPGLSSKAYFKVPRQEFVPADADPANIFVVAELTSSGKVLSSNTLYFLPAKNMALGPSQIATNLAQSGNDYKLTLESKALARTVYVSFSDLDATLSDNYFDLLPGATAEITVSSKASLDQLKSAMKVMSLGDAFTPSTTATAQAK